MKLLIFNKDRALADNLYESVKLVSPEVNLINIIDIERYGKLERQNKASFISNHELEDLKKFHGCAYHLCCRINKFGKKTEAEVNNAIESGTNSVMLPFFNSTQEISETLSIINGRVPLIPLFETAQSVLLFRDIIQTHQFEYVHFGLNDLSLQLSKTPMVSVLDMSFWTEIRNVASTENQAFGIGGCGHPGALGLDVDPQKMIEKTFKNGGSGIILSRSFFKNARTRREVEWGVREICRMMIENEILQRSLI